MNWRFVEICGESFRVVSSPLTRTWDFWDQVELGLWEPWFFRSLDLYLANNSFVDIGAWVGPFTLYAARRCRWVYAVEPDPIALNELEYNLVENKIGNVTLDSRAISNTAGTAVFGNKSQWGNSESSLMCSENGIKVKTVTLEEFFTEHKITDCGLIKMDVEGAEALILPAMAGFIRNLKIPLYLSLHRQTEQVRQEALQKIMKLWNFTWDGKPEMILLAS